MYQPSTSTKKISLKGSEIITGGSIIMPIDMRMEATTMSMLRKGRNSRKPISKARRSSLTMKAGMSARIGVASGASTSAVARKSVVYGKSVSVRVDLGGRSVIENKKQTKHRDYGTRKEQHNKIR